MPAPPGQAWSRGVPTPNVGMETSQRRTIHPTADKRFAQRTLKTAKGYFQDQLDGFREDFENSQALDDRVSLWRHGGTPIRWGFASSVNTLDARLSV